MMTWGIMNGINANLFACACRIFLRMAYPDGSLPANCQAFAHLRPEEPLDALLCPPVCEPLGGMAGQAGQKRGYAFRLGSSVFPHVKLQVIWHGDVGNWLFAVDTHDAIRLPPGDPDFDRLRQVQQQNRRLKEEVEQAWEAEGLLTFNALLRQSLG